MEFKFIDTTFDFDINGRFFTIDVGEMKTVDAVQDLFEAAASPPPLPMKG